MTDPKNGEHRYRGLIKFTGHDTYKGFSVEQISTAKRKGGIGPYRVLFQGKEIFRAKFAGDCKRHVEEIVSDYGSVTNKFVSKWKLPKFPNKTEI